MFASGLYVSTHVTSNSQGKIHTSAMMSLLFIPLGVNNQTLSFLATLPLGLEMTKIQ